MCLSVLLSWVIKPISPCFESKTSDVMWFCLCVWDKTSTCTIMDCQCTRLSSYSHNDKKTMVIFWWSDISVNGPQDMVHWCCSLTCRYLKNLVMVAVASVHRYVSVRVNTYVCVWAEDRQWTETCSKRRQTQAGETNESKVGELQPKKFERKQP